MPRAVIDFPPPVKREVWQHLLESDRDAEEAGFLFVRPTAMARHSYEVIDWYAVPVEGFAFSSAYHFELTDETRARVIKHAHDLQASLVEIHSHICEGPAAFSPSDLIGFSEFVPHVWWRLKGRPYFALVASIGGIDGLCWIDGPQAPERLGAIRVGETALAPSGRSPLRWTPELGGDSDES